MALNNDSVRDKLIEIANQGLMLKAIALNIGIDVNDLSRFKGGMECLKQSDVEILSEYLNEVYIPQWKTVKREPKKKRSNRHLLFLWEWCRYISKQWVGLSVSPNKINEEEFNYEQGTKKKTGKRTKAGK